MSWHSHQGCIYWDPIDPDILEEMEEKREEERKRLEEEREIRRKKGHFELEISPYLDRDKWGLWWLTEPLIAQSMCVLLFVVEQYPGCTVVTMRNPKREMQFIHAKKRPSTGKGQKFYRSSCPKGCAHCNGSLPGCGGCIDAHCAKCRPAKAVKDAEANAKD
jgi:hypothetical protein